MKKPLGKISTENWITSELPFEDKSFDIVYSHAVIEHVGNFANQVKMISEAIRVARKSVWMTTPYRWHPLEFHTILPLLHWLPKPAHRFVLRHIGLKYFSNEETLNLLDFKTVKQAIKFILQKEKMHSHIAHTKFLGFISNLLLHIKLSHSC